MPETPLCEYCAKEMQVADIKTDGQLNVISVRWICSCKLPEIVHKNWHAGQHPGTR